MRSFAIVAWVIGTVITAIDIASRLTHGYNINADHAIAILLIANIAAVRELWVKSPSGR